MADNVHVEDVTKQLKEKFGKESPLTTTWGNLLEYLGMTLDYTINGKVKILMYEYIEKMLTELPSDMNRSTKSPEAAHPFITR